jgi:hypothetical protein
MEKRKFLPLLGLELRPFGRPARSQSLYELRYPGSPSTKDEFKININRLQNFKHKNQIILFLYVCAMMFN